jgi:NAD(P)-dependent dehydrogenase (short-subunit alcohol dehydrogenase family)
MDTVLNEGPELEEARNIWYSRNPMGRMGDASELTGVVVLLCSRAGRYINGADILVDGMAHIHSPNLNTYKYRLGGGSVF